MTFFHDKHHRRSIRLRGYDYSRSGAYFVTICAKDRMCILGEIVDGDMRLNDAGQIVQTTWDELPSHYPGVETDEFVVMPNHVHGIIVLTDHDVRAQFIAPQSSTNDVGAQFIAPLSNNQGAMNQGAMNQGAMNQGAMNQGAMNQGAMNQGAMNQGAMNQGAMNQGAMNQGAMNRAPTLGAVVRGFKARVTAAVNGLRRTMGAPVWQRNYYEHIIRNDESLDQIRRYIADNPTQWAFDVENPVGAQFIAPNDIAPNDIAPNDIAPNDIAPNDIAPSKEEWQK